MAVIIGISVCGQIPESADVETFCGRKENVSGIGIGSLCRVCHNLFYSMEEYKVHYHMLLLEHLVMSLISLSFSYVSR